MGFKISNRKGRFGMRAFCDVCGKEVTDGDCNVLTKRIINEGENAEITIACKAQCTDNFDPSKDMANQELGMCIFHVINNSGIDIQRASEIAQLL